MKTLSLFAVCAGAAVLTTVPVSLQWSQNELSPSLDRADARIGRPATPLSVAGVARRADRRAYRRAAVYGGVAGAGAYGLGSYYGGYGNPYYSSYGYPAAYGSYYGNPGYASYASYGSPGYNYARPWGMWGFGGWGNQGYGSYASAWGNPGYGSYASYGYPRYGWGGYRGAMASAPTYYGSPHYSAYAPSSPMGGRYMMEPTGTFQAYWTAPTTPSTTTGTTARATTTGTAARTTTGTAAPAR